MKKNERPLSAYEIHQMYRDFEKKYNDVPVQMSRCDAFGHALNDGLITRDQYEHIKSFYGSLWNYTGD